MGVEGSEGVRDTANAPTGGESAGSAFGSW